MKAEKPVFNRIKAVLAERRKANKWLAEQVDVTEQTVSKWCRNEMQPTIEMLFKIANALEVDVRDLLVSNLSQK
jgi:DNA-binding XRE family transcriptional regulator